MNVGHEELKTIQNTYNRELQEYNQSIKNLMENSKLLHPPQVLYLNIIIRKDLNLKKIIRLKKMQVINHKVTHLINRVVSIHMTMVSHSHS